MRSQASRTTPPTSWTRRRGQKHEKHSSNLPIFCGQRKVLAKNCRFICMSRALKCFPIMSERTQRLLSFEQSFVICLLARHEMLREKQRFRKLGGFYFNSKCLYKGMMHAIYFRKCWVLFKRNKVLFNVHLYASKIPNLKLPFKFSL